MCGVLSSKSKDRVQSPPYNKSSTTRFCWKKKSLHATSVEEDQLTKKRHAEHTDKTPKETGKKIRSCFSQFIVNKKRKKKKEKRREKQRGRLGDAA